MVVHFPVRVFVELGRQIISSATGGGGGINGGEAELKVSRLSKECESIHRAYRPVDVQN